MREYIDTINKAFLAESVEPMVAEEIFDDIEVVENAEIVQELAGDDDSLSGTLDARALAKLLPEVDKLDPFVSAVRKVLRGSIETLTIIERTQLSKGFISLLRDSSEMTVKAMQRLKMVHKDEAAKDEF